METPEVAISVMELYFDDKEIKVNTDWEDVFFQDGKPTPVMILKGDFGILREEIEVLHGEIRSIDFQISSLKRKLESSRYTLDSMLRWLT